jgi:hypothetical protein
MVSGLIRSFPRRPAECDHDGAVRPPPGIARIALAGICGRASIGVSFFASLRVWQRFATKWAICS